MTAPTKAQLLVLAVIHNHAQDGIPPTLREIGQERHIRCNEGVRSHLLRLEMHGLLTWEPRTPRSYRVTDKGIAALWQATERTKEKG